MNFAKTTELFRRSIFGSVGSPAIIRCKAFTREDIISELSYLKIPGSPLRRTRMISAWIPRFAVRRIVELPQVEMVYLDAIARIPEIKHGFDLFNFQLRQSLGFGDWTPDMLFEQMDGWISTMESRDALEANLAETAGITGKGVKIAIVDTEASERYAQHPQLQSAVIARANFTPSPTDENGHGGHVATIAAGRRAVSRPNNIEVKGVAPSASIIAAKCLATPMGVGQTSWIVNAMDWAIEQGADIVSMSLGGPIQTPDPQVDFIAEHRGEAIFVVAAGNEGPGSATLSSPGHSPDVISVGSLSLIDEKVSSFSSRGPAPDGSIKPDVVAPGGGRETSGSVPDENIYSGITFGTLLDREADKIGNGYTAIAGTSMSTPHVSGFLALLLEAGLLGNDPTKYTDVFKSIMMAQRAKTNSLGWGMPKWSMYAGGM